MMKLVGEASSETQKGFGFRVSLGTSALPLFSWQSFGPCMMASTWKKKLNIHNLIINVDSTEAIKLLSSPSCYNRLTQPLVNDCRDTLQAFQQVHLLHCFREANRAADSLAKIGCAQMELFVSFVTPPLYVMEVLIYDSPHVIANSSPFVTDTRLPAG